MKKRHLLIALTIFIMTSLNAQFTLVIELTTDAFPEQTSITISNETSTLLTLDSYSQENTLHIDSLEVGQGEYSFEIFDSFTNGICCEFGNGEYILRELYTNSIIAEGGQFGSIETMIFSLELLDPIYGCTNPEAVNYNPESNVDDGTCLILSPLIVSLNEFADGFDYPVDITNAGDDRLFIVEKGGRIKILNSFFQTLETPFLDISDLTIAVGERGLLGLAFHPNYIENGYFYVNYINLEGNTIIERFLVSETDPNVADQSSGVVILEQDQPGGNHNAGDLNFGPDGYLYVPFGDGGGSGSSLNSQNTNSFLGKMLRIDLDGSLPYSIPEDNPFVGDPTTLDEIWAIGLRNPWRFSFDAITGDMWIGDVGSIDWEEINFQSASSGGGLNYGWRCTEGFEENNTTDSACLGDLMIEFPIAVTDHEDGVCSVIGGYVYRGESYPALQGKYFFTDFCSGVFAFLEHETEDNWIMHEFLETQESGWTTFGENNENELFVGNSNGTIYRLEDECVGLNATVTFDGDILTASAGSFYQWLLFGEEIEGAIESTYSPTDNGDYTVVIGYLNGCEATSEVVEITTGLPEPMIETTMIIPNPASNYIQLDVSEFKDIENINVYNLFGQKVKTLSINEFNGSISVNDIQNGVYILELEGSSKSLRSRFTINR